MHFFPILSTLSRHKTAAALIVLEIAVTCAIVCNAVFVISARLDRMNRPSGIAEDEIVRVQLTGVGNFDDAHAVTAADVAALEAIPGVRAAASVNMVPFGGSSWNNSMSTTADDPDPPINAAIYLGGKDLLGAFGVDLVAGRDFTADEYIQFEAFQKQEARLASVIVSRGVAERLWPGENPIGKPLYAWGDEPATVVGMFDFIARPNEGFERGLAEYSVFLPITLPFTIAGNYILRVDPERRDEVMAATAAALDKVSPNRIILEQETFAEIRGRYFEEDRAMAWLLVGVSAALLVITSLGIVGLASFWVQQRTRQIGIRRALGATRGDILRYFQTENFILATLGILLGMGLAYGINLWAMEKYGIPRLPASFLPFGAILLWFLGQVAVLGPALRAAAVPPAVATRTV